VVVSAPADDAFLDGLGFEVLGECPADKGGEFVVGGKAESDELPDRELIDVGAIFGWKECVEAQALFEADDSILCPESLGSGDTGHHEEDDGHDNPPEEKNAVLGPVVDGDVDGEDQVEQEHGQDKEMKGRIEARVVLEVLWSGHWNPLGSGLCRRAPAYHLG
jgi:hypothetical protein